MNRKIIIICAVFTVMQINAEKIHIISKGDTLYNISKRYNVTIDEIKSYNKIEDIGGLVIGSELIIPDDQPVDEGETDGDIYIVKKGDTLFSISRKFNLPLSQLMQYNNLKEGSVLALGQQLKLTIGEVESIENEIEPEPIPVEEPDVFVEADIVSTDLPYWPVEGSVTEYSGRIQGVKIEGKSGDYIKAVSNGKVIWYDSFKGIGKVVLIEGDNGYDYLYGAKEDLNVKLGVHITAGEKLGRLKESNTSIIFSVFKNGKPLSDISDAPR